MQFEKWIDVDLLKPRRFVPDLGFPVFVGDENSVRIGVNIFKGKTAETVTGTVKGYCILPNGAMIDPWAGDKEENKCWIDLPDDALVLSGRIQIAIRLEDTNEQTVIFAASATVRRVDSDSLYDPDDIVPTWDDILQKIEDMDTAAEACATATENATNAEKYIASPEASTTVSKAYAVGDYLIYDGKLYQVTTAIASGGTINTSGGSQNVSEISGGLSGEVADLKGAMDGMSTATDDDEGKALIAKTVSGGKVTEWEFGSTGFGGETEKITDFPMTTASTWAGLSKGVFILDAPIIGKSGDVVLSFYNTSTHSSWASIPFWFILYERTAAGTFTVAGKKSVDTPSATGEFSVATGWTITDDKIYYVGVWRAGSGYVPYISGGYTTFYKSGAYDSDSDFAVGSTLALSGLSSANNTILLNISVITDGKHIDVKVPRQRLVHFSVDDCVFWNDLITNESNYSSCFENTQLGYWKKLHDLFGVCVTLNCFCTNSTSSIADVPDKWAAEFAANAYWLKFAFHAEDSSTYYDTDKVDAITASYNTFVTAIIKMTGTPDAIDPITRLGFYSGTLANVQAIRDAKCGVTGLLTSDDTRISYYLATAQNTFILGHNMLFDADNQILFIHTMPRVESVNDTVSALESYLGKDWQNQNEVLEFFTHETVMTAQRELSIETYANWALIHGMHFGFTSESLLDIGGQRSGIGDGKDGENGKSAYAYAVEGGYTGSEQDFCADLAAMDGLADDLAAI